MEQQGRTQLFERTSSGIVLTEAGMVFLTYAASICEQTEATFNHLDEIKSAVNGLLTHFFTWFFFAYLACGKMLP